MPQADVDGVALQLGGNAADVGLPEVIGEEDARANRAGGAQ